MSSTITDMLAELRALPEQTVPAARVLRRAWSKQCQTLSGKDLLKLAEAVQERGGVFGRFLAAELVHFHPEARTLLNATALRRLGEGMASWDAVDVFACFLSGPAWREGQIADAEIHRWAKSSDHWWRRAALVS